MPQILRFQVFVELRAVYCFKGVESRVDKTFSVDVVGHYVYI